MLAVRCRFGGRSECDWTATGSTLGGDGTVDVYYAGVQGRSAFDTAKAGLPGVVDVTGIGDGAYYSSYTTSLEFVQGQTVVAVQYLAKGSHPEDAALQHREAALGSAIAGHL